MDTTQPARPGHLLVVDDDPAILALLRDTFRDDGYRVSTATGVAAGIAMLRTFRVDLVLADAFRADDCEPWASLDRLRDRARGTPVVICSAHTERSFEGYAARGFAGLVTKPFDLDALSAVMRQTMDHARRRHGQRHVVWTIL